jgi:hypothetical protein
MKSRDLEYDVARMFAADVAEHRMIVALDHGLHRHLVFQRRRHSWNGHFELITAPGSLTITGDRGAHVFRRDTDMFAFFRGYRYGYGINASYWAEKLPDYGRSVQVYSQAAFEQHLDELLDDLAAEYRYELLEWRAEVNEYGADAAGDKPQMPERLREARELIADARHYGNLSYREGADELRHELERAEAASDTWEWNVEDYDFSFLWCLHAIAWGVRQYDDAVKTGLHKIRTGVIAEAVPLPTTAPATPKPPPPVKKATAPRPYVVTAKTAAGVL